MSGYLLIALACIVYLKTLKYGLVNDDKTVMLLAPYNVKYERSVNIILHLVVCLYICYAFGSSMASLTAAVLFAIHPTTVQITAWKSGRHHAVDALIVLFVIAFLPWSAAGYWFMTRGYPTIALTPLMFLFSKYWYLALLTPLLVWLNIGMLKKIHKVKIEGDGFLAPALPKGFTMHQFKWTNLIIVVKTFGYYTLAGILPFKNGFYNSFLVTLNTSGKETAYWHKLNRHFWGGFLAIVAISVTYWFNRNNMVGLGLALYVLSIGPYCNFITIQQFTTPRYAYVATIGLQIALAGLLSHCGIFWIMATFGLGLFYFDRLTRVLEHYKTDQTMMYELEIQVFPDNPRIWYYRYEHFLNKQNPVCAWYEASHGLKYCPEDAHLWFGLAVSSFELGDYKAAGTYLDTSERFMFLTEMEQMKKDIYEFRRVLLAVHKGHKVERRDFNGGMYPGGGRL